MRLKDVFSRKEKDLVQEPNDFSINSRPSTFSFHAPATLSAGVDEPHFAGSSGTAPSESRHGNVNYWARAASELQLEQPTKAKILSEFQRQSSSNHCDIIESLRAEIKTRREELEQKRWRFKLGEKTIILRDQLARISKAGQAFKDLGGTLTGLDPLHAGLPWAGICFLMQLTLGDTDQYTAMVSAAEEVSILINRYKHVEYICQRRQDVGLRDEFEKLLVKLYKHILDFQVSAACYYRHKTFIRFIRAPAKMDDVSEVLNNIRGVDTACRALGEVFDTKDDIIRHSELLALLKTNKETLDKITQKVSLTVSLRPKGSENPVHVPFAFDSDPKFTGRGDTIELLDASFQTFRRMALLGWAGVGKSQIAIEYAHRVRMEKPSTRIFWVRGARPDAFIKSYRDIARKLELPGCDEPDADSSEILSNWLCDPANGDWLMVLDNVDDETVFSSTSCSIHPDKPATTKEFHGLQRHLPQVSHGSILVTSRNRVAARDITNEADCIILVDRLPNEDAFSLLRKKLPSDKSPDDDFRDLLGLLENLPLAITQAAAYISKSSRMTVSRYLSLFRLDQMRYLEIAANDIRRDSEGTDDDFSNSVLKTWFISFNHIKKQNPDAAESLCFMSLVFGQGIPIGYLLCGDEIDQQEVEENVGPLVEFELISEEKDGLFSIHRLVQLSVRSWLSYNNELSRNTEIAAQVLQYRFPYPSYETWRTCELLLPHVETVLSYTFSTLHGLSYHSLLFSESAFYYNSKGNWALSVERATRARQISEEHFKEDLHVTRYCAEIVMILAQQNLGNLKEAEEIARALLARARRISSDDESMKTRATALLGRVLVTGGKYSEAERFIREALHMQEKHLDKADERVLSSLANLAHVLTEMCKFTAGCQTMETLVERARKIKGPTHSLTLLFMNNYGNCLNQSDRPEEAEQVLYEALQTRTTLLSENHPDTILTMANYALALIFQGKIAEAEHWTDKALALTKENGLEGQTSFHLHHNKGFILKEKDQVHEAKKCLEEAVRVRKQHLGAVHPCTILSILTLSQCEMDIGNLQAAEENLGHVHQEFKSQLGEDHLYTLLALSTMSLLRSKQGRKTESVALATDCLTRSQQALGPEHSGTIQYQSALAHSLCCSDRHVAAIECITEATATASRVYPHRFELHLSLQTKRALILSDMPGKYEDAASAYQGLIDQYDKTYKKCRSEVVWARRHYARVLCKLGRCQEAETLSRSNVDICKDSVGMKSLVTCVALEGLAYVLSQAPLLSSSVSNCSSLEQEQSLSPSHILKLQQDREARMHETLEIRESVLSIKKELQGEDGEPALRAASEIAHFFKQQGEDEKALKWFQNIRARRQDLLGPEHPETLTSAHEEADLLRTLSRNEEAAFLSRKVWLERKNTLGADDPDTMSSKNNLALCLRSIEKPEEARQLDQELYEDKIRIFGNESLETIHTMNNLAMDYYDLQSFGKAEELLRKVVELRRKNLGTAEQHTLLSISNLGLVLQEKGNLSAAEALFREVFAHNTQLYGLTQHSTVESRNKLSTCLRKQSKNDEAIHQLESSLSCLRNELGPIHFRTISAMKLLASSQYLCNEFSQAESTYRELLDMSQGIHQPRLKARLETFGEFAAVLKALEKFPEAEKSCRRAFKGRQVILGIDHKDTLFSAWSLIDCLITQKKLSEAEPLCHETITLREATVGKYHRQTVYVLQQLANIFFGQGRSTENLRQLEIVLERIEVNKGELMSMHRPALQNLINAHYSAASWTLARRYLDQYIKLQEDTYGSDSAEAGAVLLQLGTLEFDLAHFYQSATHYRKVKEIYESLKKIVDDEYLRVITSLSEILLKLDERKTARVLCDQAIELDGNLSLLSSSASSTPPPKSRPLVYFSSRARIARILFSLGRIAESETFASTVIDQGSKTLPSNDIAIFNSRRTLARIMARTSGRESEGLILMREVFFKYVEDSTKGVRVTSDTAVFLGEMCGQLRKFWEGEIVLRGAWRKLRRLFGEEHAWTVAARREYILLLARAYLDPRKDRMEESEL